MNPLTLFNTQKFGIFEYHEKLNSFEQMRIKDEENLADKVPKNFKSAYLGNEVETYLIAGGFDPQTMKISKRAFLLERGNLREVIKMYKGR
jgi:hypothetical protein